MTRCYRVTIQPLAREIECREDQTILDACLRSGIWLPHACTHGTCGTCKADVLDGEVDYGEASQFALMEFERDEGKALLCSAKPLSDVEIEGDVDEEPGVTTYPVRDYVGVVSGIEDCAVDVRKVFIDLDEDMEFNPGQYVLLTVPGANVVRSYSMANTPSMSRRVELHIRRTPNGVASDGWIFNSLSVGDEVDLSGPFGRFFLREVREEPAIFVAGGTGVAPIKSIIRDVLERGLGCEMFLYQGARTLDMLYDVEFFLRLETEYPQFRYRPCLSEETVEGYCTGLVTEVLDREFETCHGHVGYVCGPPPMVDAALKTFMRKRLFPRDIYREDFYDESDRASGGVRSPLLKR